MVNIIDIDVSSIPKKIHQIAPSDKSHWHPHWFKCQESWLNTFSDFEYNLWNDKEDLDQLIYIHYPQFKNLYDSFPVHIMKIDFARLCILHKFGGIYGDMDYFVYKNFYRHLNKRIGFLKNDLEEYTTAKFENCLMYSEPNNPLLYEIIKYVKFCFIYFRGKFSIQDNNWRTAENDYIVNNTTGSGMISAAVKNFSNTDYVGELNSRLFNNRPSSYDPSYYGKHVHTTAWGKEYVENYPEHLLIDKYGRLFLLQNEDLNDKEIKNKDFTILKTSEFDFFKDYTNGLYIKENNLDDLKKILT